MNHIIKNIIILVVILLTTNPYSQSFYGVSGAINTPTTDVVDFKSVAVGFGTLQDTSYYIHNYHVSMYAVIGFLPNLEFSLRVGGPPSMAKPENSDLEFPYYFIDRMMSFKWKVLDEKEYIPAFALGIQDFIGQEKYKNYNSLYFVSKKTFDLPVIRKTEFNIGVGTTLWDKIANKAGDHRFIGVFGSIKNNIADNLSFIGEYDAKHFNAALEYKIKKFADIKLCLTEGKYIGGIVNFTFGL